MSDQKPARYRELFTLDATSAIVWRPRAASDFADVFNLSADAAAARAQDWAMTKAGRPPRWQHSPRGLATTADRLPVLFDDVCAALGIAPRVALKHASAIALGVQHDRAKSAVLRLTCRKRGQIVWADRTEENAPKTPERARRDFNKTWAGRPVHVRDGHIKIQRLLIKLEDATAWLEEQDKTRQDNATQDDTTPEELTPETVAAWRASGMSAQDMVTKMKAMGWDDLPDSALLDILKQY
jgi:hypothetical protein